MKKYYVRVNRGYGATTEAYATKKDRDQVVNWEYGRKITAKDAHKLDSQKFEKLEGGAE